ncbi:PepSY domain-containing protein (plasmid) [Rhizobium sp. 32-5/1]|uniref:PepSY-associated TM helix domain-containing protein n=1 Tax=Rhizobium sp. 32-5/1 TaxID=3019602 RepID=UPI00240E2844|nr:PepSY domain-containing protein [Rhizobium sp. 32-5/1]WEZ85930.1 PepSY domain-containing protein [Rhizobium sp. 32-5/1]
MSSITTIPDGRAEQTSSRSFYLVAWRWHFYAGLYVAPFLVMLATTGLMMLWTSVLFGRDGEKYYTITPAQTQVAVSVQAGAARAAIPDGRVVQYIAPRTADGAAIFRVNRGEASSMVAVDPYSGSVLADWERRDGLYDLANKIHGTLMIGDPGDRLIEVAAGFGIVLVITGLYLWWPRDERGLKTVLVPQFAARGRQLWKSLHITIGFYISVILVLFLVSGLSWTGIWGEKFTQAWSTFPAAKWDNVPLSDATHANMNHGGIKEVPWALEQTPMPMSGSDAGKSGLPEGEPVNLDGVVAFARSIGFTNRFQLGFPTSQTGVWTVSRDTMSNDSANPLSDRTVHIDQHSGKVLADIGFKDYGAPAKAMAIGIAFHEGDMGIWNVALVTVFCVAILFMSVSGIVLWWKRRPRGAARLVAPAAPTDMKLWRGGALIMITVSLLFPLTGAVLLTVVALDHLIISRVKPLRRVLN